MALSSSATQAGAAPPPSIPWAQLRADEQKQLMDILLRAEERATESSASAPVVQESDSSATVRTGLELPGANLSFQNLAYSVDLPDGSSKQILEPCSGHFQAGQLVAIMGPSGCGKTTMLDMLAMKKTAKFEGEVRVNGHQQNPRTFRRIAAYVGQEDQMPAHWQVREAIEFNARLKQQGGHSRGKDTARELVDVLLEEFGLFGVANTYVGGAQVRGISGGQRRRVSLARAVAARAPILFCDEPTSGLSATDAEICVRALQAITRRFNVLTIIVIHQPRIEVVDLFDTLVLLTANPGRMTYFGPMAQARDYFRTLGFSIPPEANPADCFMDLITPGSSTDASSALVAAFQSRQAPDVHAKAVELFETKGPTVSEMLEILRPSAQDARRMLSSGRSARVSERAAPIRVQIAQVLKRKISITFRNPLAGALTVFLPCVMGTLLGSLFQGIGDRMFLQQVSFFFILVTGSCFQSMGFMAQLIEERTYMKYETSEALYDEAVMALANFCVDVPLALLGASAQILIAYAFSGFSVALFQTIFLWTLLVFFVFDSLFACVAAFAPDAQLAQLVATPFLTIFMLFNGFVVSKDSAPAWFKWIFEISPNFYTMEQIVITVADHEGPEAQGLVSAFGYQHGHTTQALLVMLGSVVFFRLLQVVALKAFNSIQR